MRRGKRLEYLTIGYNSLEGIIAVVAGLFAGSIALVGFGIDSVIEVTSGAALLWRLRADVDEGRRERALRRPARLARVPRAPDPGARGARGRFARLAAAGGAARPAPPPPGRVSYSLPHTARTS